MTFAVRHIEANNEEPLRIVVWKRTQQHGIYNGKDGDCGTDPQSQVRAATNVNLGWRERVLIPETIS
jgi:hypothetical protein